MKTALSENRSCQNCAFRDGCKGSMWGTVCSEHKFEWEVEDEPTEKEKRLMYGDYQYQCFKEE
jgi:hypothetical protein